MPKLDIQKLNSLYLEGVNVDQELFAEQRSNILLVSGDHYTKKGSEFWSRIKDVKDLSNEMKIRLTKNHTQKITKLYINSITSYAPSVGVSPKNEKELQDQKASELNHAVWQDMRARHNIKGKTREWAEDYVNIGECVVKVFFDPNKGEFKGYDPSSDPENPKPVFSGDVVFERFFGFDVLRAQSAKSFEDSPYVILRKMVQVKDLKKMVAGDKEKEKFVEESSADTYRIFDNNRSEYTSTKGQVMVREYYFRPCYEYPSGYFFITTELGILFEGELPGGIFPVKYVGFDQIPTQARSRSIIKQLRPYQAEINRSASQIATHQVTLGDDKILIQAGTKITQGNMLPGVRAVQVSGMNPQILPGRAGTQHLDYMNSQISEMYSVANLKEEIEERENKMEAYMLLFNSLKDKKKYSLYTEKFEQFLVSVCDTALRYAKFYYNEENLVPAIGKNEYVNISEFKNTNPLQYEIKLEPQVDDVETKLGKMMTAQQILQYAGKNLSKQDLGRLIRSLPYSNNEELAEDLTLDYDNATNMILALDRGEVSPPLPGDDNTYLIKRLTNRTRKSDFFLLSEEIKNNYAQTIAQLEQVEAERLQQLKLLESEFIPSGGYLVACDFYVDDPKTGATKRARLPYQAIDWLIKALEAQGMAQEKLQSMQPNVQGEIASQYMQQAHTQTSKAMDQAQAGAMMA